MLLRRTSHQMPVIATRALESLEPGLDFFGRSCELSQDRLEAPPPTLVEVLRALRVLAEQGRFGR